MKYELTDEKIERFGKTLYRIKALKSFGNVTAGETGGYVEKESNLSQEGNAWVSDNAEVTGNARVYGDAWVSDNAEVTGNARVYGDAWVYGDAEVTGNARVYGDAWVYGDAEVKTSTDVLWMTPVGSENGTLTVARSKSGGLLVCRGCFSGTLGDFEKAVEQTHGNNRYAKEYEAAIKFIKLRFGIENEEETVK